MADKSINSVIFLILGEIEKEITMNLCRDDYEIGFGQGLKLAHRIVEGYKEQGGERNVQTIIRQHLDEHDKERHY